MSSLKNYVVKEYREEWESYPQLQDWVSPAPDDPTKAYCKVCKKDINATLNGLVLHSSSKRHRMKICDDEATVSVECTDGDKPNIMVLCRKKNLYAIKYNEKWEKDPVYSKWVRPDPSSDKKAICILCRTTLRAHKADLSKHLVSIKHKTNDIISSSGFYRPYIPVKAEKKKVQEKIQRHDGTCVIVESDAGVLFPNTQNTSNKMIESDDMVFEVTEPTAELGQAGIQGLLPELKSYKERKSKEMRSFDKKVSYVVDKVGDFIISDIRKLLHQQKELMKAVRHEGFSKGDEGVERITKVLIGHLSQHYLVEGAVNSWKVEMSKEENDDDGSIDIASRLASLEETIEGSILEVRNLKSKVVPPQAIAADSILEDDMLEADDPPVTHSFHIECL